MTEERDATLVLGGARSGKSAVAERLAMSTGRAVTYVATGPGEDGADDDWRARLAVHRARRPAAWATAEVAAGGDLAGVLRRIEGAAVVDSVGTWLAGYDRFAADVAGLCDAVDERSAAGRPTVLVSEEAGLGVHPSTALGARFRDALGEANQALAARCQRVVLVVAGRVLELPGADSIGGAP